MTVVPCVKRFVLLVYAYLTPWKPLNPSIFTISLIWHHCALYCYKYRKSVKSGTFSAQTLRYGIKMAYLLVFNRLSTENMSMNILKFEKHENYLRLSNFSNFDQFGASEPKLVIYSRGEGFSRKKQTVGYFPIVYGSLTRS